MDNVSQYKSLGLFSGENVNKLPPWPLGPLSSPLGRDGATRLASILHCASHQRKEGVVPGNAHLVNTGLI